MCVFIKVHIAAQSGPVILVILCHSHYSSQARGDACVCVFFPFVLDSRLVDVPAGVTQEEGHTGFLIHLPSAVLASIRLARKIQAFLSLVDREVEFGVLTIKSFSTCWSFLFFILFLRRKNPSFTGIRTHVLTCQKVSRFSTEPPGRPYIK